MAQSRKHAAKQVQAVDASAALSPESQAQLQSVITMAPIVLFTLDAHGVVTFSAGKGLEAMGVEPGASVGKSFLELYEDVPAATAMLRRALAGETLTEVVNMRGTVFEARMTPTFDGQGNVTEVTGVAIDVTAHHQTQHALETERQQLLSIFDSIDEPVYVSDPETYELLYVNKAFRRQWGEGTGYRCYRVLHNHREPCAFCTNAHLFGENAGKPYIWEVHNKSNNRWYRCIDKAIRWPDGRMVRCELAIDITEHRRAEQALAESQRTLFTLMSNLPGMVYRCLNDHEWTMTFVSDGCYDLTGYQPAELIGNKRIAYGQVIHSDDRDMVWNEAQVALDARQPFQLTYRIVTADGVEKWVWEQGRGLVSDDGELLAIEGFITDITERRRLQDQLLQAQKLESIGTLAGGIAHDFNNMLAVVMGNASIARRDPSLPAKIQEALSDIMNAAERGSSLTHQLLAYARGGVFRPVPTDLNRLIRSIMPMLKAGLPDRVEFELNLAENLPNVTADPPRVEQIVMNLCLNAVQASKPPCTITVATEEATLSRAQAGSLQLSPGRYLRLDVKDHGCGIHAEVLERIFDPFFTTSEMGRGMGLSATHGIVQSHRGQIKVDSRPGEGTSVSVWLPVCDRPEVSVNAPTPRRQKPPRGTETVLIIDDEPAVSRTLGEILSSLGYCVVSHTDTDQAIAFLASNAEDVHLTIIDLYMPKRSGFELAELIHTQYAHIKVLLTSGSDEQDIKQPDKQHLIVGFIPKPFDLHTLACLVRQTLDVTREEVPPSS